MAFAGLSEKVEYWDGELGTLSERLAKEMEPDELDFVFMYHQKELYLTDLQFLETNGLLKKGTCIVGDNILYPGVPDYRKYVETNRKYYTKLYETELPHKKFNQAMKDITTVSIFQSNFLERDVEYHVDQVFMDITVDG